MHLQRDVAHRVLGEFKNMPNAWTHVAVILNVSQDANTKFFALQILESTITVTLNCTVSPTGGLAVDTAVSLLACFPVSAFRVLWYEFVSARAASMSVLMVWILGVSAVEFRVYTLQTRWNILPEAERNGIKAFVTSLVIQLASDPQQYHSEKHFINKVNENLIQVRIWASGLRYILEQTPARRPSSCFQCGSSYMKHRQGGPFLQGGPFIVFGLRIWAGHLCVSAQIVKREWPERWPSFITEVCQSCRSSQSICENNMRLLNMLSEEVFDFGRNEMVSKRVDKLMDQLTAQFQEVYDTCMFVLKSYIASPAGMRETLVQQTLKCLAHFLKWVPLGFIFETDLIETLLQHFWEPVQYRPECIRCVTEMASLQLSPEEAAAFKHRLAALWIELVTRVVALPRQTLQYEDPGKVPPQMRLFWESIYCQLALCLTGEM